MSNEVDLLQLSLRIMNVKLMKSVSGKSTGWKKNDLASRGELPGIDAGIAVAAVASSPVNKNIAGQEHVPVQVGDPPEAVGEDVRIDGRPGAIGVADRSASKPRRRRLELLPRIEGEEIRQVSGGNW